MKIDEIKTRQKEIQEEIKKLEQESNELEKQLSITPWRAELDDAYWFISESGEVESDEELHSEIDNYRYNSGNYYKCSSDAQYVLTSKKIARRILLIATKLNNGEEINWNNTREKKYYMCLSFIGRDKVDIDITQRYTERYKIPGTIYCKSKYFLEECINEIGKEDLIYFNKENSKEIYIR